MIIGDQREAVIANIADAARAADFHRKVEVNDPVLTPEQEADLVAGYLKRRRTAPYRCRSFAARRLANIGTRMVNRDTRIIGLEKAAAVTGGAIGAAGTYEVKRGLDTIYPL